MQALTRAAPDFAALDAAASAAAADTAASAFAAAAPPDDALRRSSTVVSRRAAWLRATTAALFAHLLPQLSQAELLELQPDASVSQDSTVLLLAGDLVCAPDMPTAPPAEGVSLESAVDAVRWLCNAGRYRGQGLLPAFWEVLTAEDLALAPGEGLGCVFE